MGSQRSDFLISGNMAEFGLIGYPLSHSFSPRFFYNFFKEHGLDHRYRSVELKDEEALSHFFKSEIAQFKGLNVTIPYKEAVIPLLQELDINAEQIAAVNVVKVFENSFLKGYNTDGPAFLETLNNWFKPANKSAIVLGNGGASKAVVWALEHLELNTLKVSRSKRVGNLTYSELSKELVSEASIIVNTTPLGTSPDIDDMPPIEVSWIREGHFVYDLVYNPEKTLFLKLAEARGASVKNGYEMLVSQAIKSWQIWNDDSV